MENNYLIPFQSIHIQRFWDTLKNKKLIAPKCKRCGQKFFPPGAHCPNCLSKELEWFELSGKGTLYSWTSIEYLVEKPRILGIVELKEKIGRSIAYIFAKEDELKIGMQMKINYVKEGEFYFFNWVPTS